MLAEALKFLTDLGRQSAAFEVQQIEGDPTNLHIFSRMANLHTTHPLPRPPRQHRVMDLAQMVAYLEAHYADPDTAAAVCWVGQDRVTAILDESGYRRNRVYWPLTLTPQATTLMELEANKTLLEPSALIRMIRLDLACRDHPLITGLRKVDWELAKRATSETSRGRESLGKTIEAKVGTVEEIPEDETVTVPVFEADCCSDRTVECTVEIDAYQARVGLIPEPGQMRAAILTSLRQLADELRSRLPSEIPVYLGSPE